MNQQILITSSLLAMPFIALTAGESIKESVALRGSSFAKTKAPNLVFILVDDMGYGDLAAHGNPVIKTPNMDRLHKESVRFTNFNVSPTCAPTRAALMSGKHEFKVDVSHTIKGRNRMNTKATTIAQVLKSGGYKTGLFGKWHLGTKDDYRPEKRGFDVALTCINDTQNHHFDPTLLRNNIEEQHKGYRTDIFFEEAMSFIEKNKNDKFFCYIPTYSPHDPLKVPTKWSDMYSNKGNKGSKNFLGMVSNVDHNIGLLRKKIDELGLKNNTVIVLINDNGGTYGVNIHNAGMRGRKGHALYGGIRALSFWCWPGQWKPAEHDQVSAHVDLFPTFAKLAKTPLNKSQKKGLDGTSLLTLLENNASKSELAMFEDRMLTAHRSRWSNTKGRTAKQLIEEHKYSYCCVRWKHYILVRAEHCPDKSCHTCSKALNRSKPNAKGRMYTTNGEHYITLEEGKWKLYDLKKDLFQNKDISNSKPELTKRMADHYEQWWKEAWKR